MTPEEIKIIDNLRARGLGYRKIAGQTGISENTVKSYLRKTKKAVDLVGQNTDDHKCLYCGTPVKQHPGRKLKKFCSDACRNKWWKEHQNLVKRSANYYFTCPTCGKEFIAYGNERRKYCSHACYIIDRFGGVR